MSAAGTPRLSVRTLSRVALKIGLIAALVFFGGQIGTFLSFEFAPHLTPSTEPAVHRMIVVSLAVYGLLMMIPFIPGVEIGLGLMVVFGKSMIPVVWAVTVLALSLSFLVGHLLPERLLIALARWLGLGRLASALHDAEAKPLSGRLQVLLASAPQRWTQVLLRHRILLLVLAVNLPGNAVIGGGGGIALLAGFSRLISFPAFVVAITAGTAPVPVAMLLAG